jgi:hypothetical protein
MVAMIPQLRPVKSAACCSFSLAKNLAPLTSHRASEPVPEPMLAEGIRLATQASSEPNDVLLHVAYRAAMFAPR